ncbi:MAG: hypothetical protein IPH54_02405 [Rhodoferax sp.]|nr:hypothetical protein [Rhodoferax sp.]
MPAPEADDQILDQLQTIAMVRRTRQVGEKTSEETHYYISVCPERRESVAKRSQPLGGK